MAAPTFGICMFVKPRRRREFATGAISCTIRVMRQANMPQSPFAPMADLAHEEPVRSLAPGDIKKILESHRLYLETDRKHGERANLRSVDLAGFSFAGMDLRRVNMRRAVLEGADLGGADLRRV